MTVIKIIYWAIAIIVMMFFTTTNNDVFEVMKNGIEEFEMPISQNALYICYGFTGIMIALTWPIIMVMVGVLYCDFMKESE